MAENNNGIKLNMHDKNDGSPISLMSQGYSELVEDSNVSQTTSAEQQAEIARRIEAGNFENIPNEALIAYGLGKLTEDTSERKKVKREFRRKQEARAEAQVKLFGIEYVDEKESRWYKGE